MLHKVCLDNYPIDCKLVHIDIDDFFMSCDHLFIVQHVGTLIGCRKLRRLVRKVLTFFLRVQYIESSAVGGLRRMCRGSSQGLPHRGYVSVLCFLHAVELAGPGLVHRRFRSTHGILHDQRAIDNMLFVLDRFGSGENLCRSLNEVMGAYTCKIEDNAGNACNSFDPNSSKARGFTVAGVLTSGLFYVIKACCFHPVVLIRSAFTRRGQWHTSGVCTPGVPAL